MFEVGRKGVKLVVRCHHHVRYDASIANGCVKVMGVGLTGVGALDSSVIRKGKRSTRWSAVELVVLSTASSAGVAYDWRPV
jgi:hypothetical protein